MTKTIKRIVAGAAGLAAVPALALVGAQPSVADEAPRNVTVAKGKYMAIFRHTSKEGETLEVIDQAPGDGNAAVAYVTFAVWGETRRTSPPTATGSS